jgi:hypothetical protein
MGSKKLQDDTAAARTGDIRKFKAMESSVSLEQCHRNEPCPLALAAALQVFSGLQAASTSRSSASLQKSN